MKHVHLTASLDTLQGRFSTRSEHQGYEEARRHPVEKQVATLRRSANLVINTGRLNEEAVLERVVSWLGLTA